MNGDSCKYSYMVVAAYLRWPVLELSYSMLFNDTVNNYVYVASATGEKNDYGSLSA
jgi:hypothetical protein